MTLLVVAAMACVIIMFAAAVGAFHVATEPGSLASHGLAYGGLGGLVTASSMAFFGVVDRLGTIRNAENRQLDEQESVARRTGLDRVLRWNRHG